MTWGEGSHIPAAVKRAVQQRDAGECQLRYPGICTRIGEEFDHIDGLAERGMTRRQGNQSSVDELQLACPPCHTRKTQNQAAAGRARWRRPPERHPGLRYRFETPGGRPLPSRPYGPRWA